ncbi:MAG: N-acetyltransferase [Lewinellaceae bacterium]|nr:hypothetical protein [Phaeodactylibacter sp.]MCB9035218.1 N-acetyltransferase [Lewinellaceae bacterium]
MEIIKVTGKKEWKQFFRFPWRIYQGDPHWAPPLLMEQKKLLSTRRNPFFLNGKAQGWISRQKGEMTGRIIAFTDPHHNEFHGDKTGFIGFFECLNDQETADALFEQAAAWLRSQGMAVARGPVNLSTANECGLLASGFEYPPFIQMNHTPPYYLQLFKNWGFRKVHRLLAYHVVTEELMRKKELLGRLETVSKRVLSQQRITLRPLNMRRYQEEVRHIARLYNAFMNNNWGFVPVTEQEMFFMGESLKLIVDPEMVFFIEINGAVAGCSLSVPNINQILPRLNGRLFPLGFLKFLYHRSRINTLRLMLIGVSPGFRNCGLDALLYYYTITEAARKGYIAAELSWISEDNANLISIMDKLGARLYKTYWVYDKKI